VGDGISIFIVLDLSALLNSSTFSSGEAPNVNLIALSPTWALGEALDEIEAEYNGAPISIGFNAVGHSILVIAYHLLTRKQAYSDLGAKYFDERDRQAVTNKTLCQPAAKTRLQNHFGEIVDN
jgi:hypothetical protein